MIAVFSWWLALELCGLLALPVAWRLFARLPGRGYAFAKSLGLLLAAYVLWLGASTHLLPNDLGGIMISLLVVAVLSFWLGRTALQRSSPDGEVPLLAWLRANLKPVLATEILFLVAFVAWAFFRAYSGEISATEKPMEFAFINGVLNSRFFPPQDPWLSGYAISYYYFGYVMLAFLIRLTGVLPAVGFNLGVAMWFALVLTAAFGIVYELVRLAGGRKLEAGGRDLAGADGNSGVVGPRLAGPAAGQPADQASGSSGTDLPGSWAFDEPVGKPANPTRGQTRAIGWGLVGALFVGVVGNLEGLVEAGYNAGFLPLGLVQWLDIKDLLAAPPTGNLGGSGWWWWHASRVIHDKDLLGVSAEVIDEFPFFSFLLGDLHPHVLALPFVLLAIALALNLLLAARDRKLEAGSEKREVGETEAGSWELEAGSSKLEAGGLRASISQPAAHEARPVGAGPISSVQLPASSIPPSASSIEHPGAPGADPPWLRRGGRGSGLSDGGVRDHRPGLRMSAGYQLRVSSFESRASSIQLRASTFLHSLGDTIGLGTPGILLYGLALGALAFLNTWDFPIYLALVTLAFGTGLALREGLTWRVAGQALAAGIIFGLIGYVAYLPFYIGFQSQAGGLLPNLLFPTRLSQFFLMFGLFLVVVVFFLALVAHELPGRSLRRRFLSVLPWPLLVPVVLISSLLLLALVLPQGQAMVQDLLNNPAVRSHLPAATLGALLGLIARLRLATPWTYLLLAGLIAWAVALLWGALPRGAATTGHDGAASGATPVQGTTQVRSVDLFAVLLIGLALLLVFSVEFIYLRDNFGTRMNTVFKFYYQAWILLALASAYGLSRLAERSTPLRLQAPALLLAVLLGAAGMLYPLLATPSKANDFRGPATLDGLAYLRQYNPRDAAAIDWLRRNVSPSALVLEAPGGSYSSEGAERVSMATGNPTLLGWDFHERQWRGKAYDALTAGRPEAIDRIYRSARPEDIRPLLDQWNVDYVYIGDLERRKYGIGDAAMARFDRAGLQLVYDAQGVRIYGR